MLCFMFYFSCFMFKLVHPITHPKLTKLFLSFLLFTLSM